MKQQYAVIVLFALIITSSLTSLDSYRTTNQMVCKDMDRALALALEEQIAELRGKATIAVDTRSKQFKAYTHCSEATIFSLSDQRPAALLWLLTGFWAMFVWYRKSLSERVIVNSEKLATAIPLPFECGFGGLTYSEAEGRFFAADGNVMKLTPMQHQLMTMFFQSPSHSLSKAEICEALWPKKPDASDTLYTLIRRLKPVIEQHSDLKIESDRSKSYRLEIRQIGN